MDHCCTNQRVNFCVMRTLHYVCQFICFRILCARYTCFFFFASFLLHEIVQYVNMFSIMGSLSRVVIMQAVASHPGTTIMNNGQVTVPFFRFVIETLNGFPAITSMIPHAVTEHQWSTKIWWVFVMIITVLWQPSSTPTSTSAEIGTASCMFQEYFSSPFCVCVPYVGKVESPRYKLITVVDIINSMVVSTT